MNAEYIKVCKRLNNTKRNYLVLNEAQCKHVPCSPTKALEMFAELGDKVRAAINRNGYADALDKVLIIGFAETATAIGHHIALQLGCSYVHTTREKPKEGFEYYEFDETHSHAVSQRLISLNSMLSKKDFRLIILVEDEITTGSTMLHLIDKITDMDITAKFVVASLLNGMSAEQRQTFKDFEIDMEYLAQIDNSNFSAIADSIPADGEAYEVLSASTYRGHIDIGYSLINHRYDCDTTRDRELLDKLADATIEACSLGEKVLCLGTEEFMYPAIYVGSKLEEQGLMVKSHSTTRSPIAVSMQEDYPLNTRIKLESVYDFCRETYLYNLEEYNRIFIFTERVTNIIPLLAELRGKVKNPDNIVIYQIGEIT